MPRAGVPSWLVPAAVALATLVGLLLRLHLYDRSLIGDELSTLWIVREHGLLDTVRIVGSNAEITPPLNFVLAWFSTRIGDGPELVRLPSLIAGTATIPLLYLLGRWTVGIRAGLAGSAIFALSPFMTYFAANGRAYAVTLLFLAGSTLLMLQALKTGRLAFWVAYGLLSCLAMYSHYTAAFVLVAQLAWLLVLHPKARVPALLANGVAAVLYLPWLPKVVSDLDSPTTEIMEALQGSGFAAKMDHFQQWAFGHQLFDPAVFPGTVILVVILAGLLLPAVTVLIGRSSRSRPVDEPVRGGLWLLVTIALAAPAFELILLLFGTDLLSSRNMAASWYGLAAAFGAVIALPGGLVTIVSAILVLGGYSAAAVKLWGPDGEVVDFKAAAKLIDREAASGDAVLDIVYPTDTPVPLTPLAAEMENRLPYFPIGLPEGDPPFVPSTAAIPPDQLLNQALRRSAAGSLFLRVPAEFQVRSASPGERPDNADALSSKSLVLPARSEATMIGESDSGGWAVYRIDPG